MTTKPRQSNPAQLRAAISGAFDTVLARRAHHESVVRELLTRPGYSPDQALVRLMAQEFGSRIDRRVGRP